MTYFPVKARSECVAPADDALGGVVEIMRIFHAACAASQRPGARPIRGSGVGAVIETIGVTGGGMTAGGGGGGVGRAPPRAPARFAGSAGGAVCWVCSACGGDCGAAACGAAVITTPINPEISVEMATTHHTRECLKNDSAFFIGTAPSD